MEIFALFHSTVATKIKLRHFLLTGLRSNLHMTDVLSLLACQITACLISHGQLSLFVDTRVRAPASERPNDNLLNRRYPKAATCSI
jgi:hypothetical protein